MSDYAKVENGIVIDITVMPNHSKDSEDWLEANLGGNWVACNFDENPKSIAGVNCGYDLETGWFIPEQPFESWVFEKEKWQWIAPVEMPNDGLTYLWNEQESSWVEAPPVQDV